MLLGDPELIFSTIAGQCYPMCYAQLVLGGLSAQDDPESEVEATVPLFQAQLGASKHAEMFCYMVNHATLDPLPVPHELRQGAFTSYELFFSKKGTRVCADSELGIQRQHGEVWDIICLEVVCIRIRDTWLLPFIFLLNKKV